MRDTPRQIELVSVAVGRPSIIGTNRQGEVTSGIAKHEIPGGSVFVKQTNIDGDGQADLVNHGGIDKAVYCYPREHRQYWTEELNYQKVEAPFGENLSVLGITEVEACIGDTWRWGEVLLQISQPRWPCFKLAMHTRHLDMVKRFVASGRSGWYMRVLEEGIAPVSGTIELVDRDSLGVTVQECVLARRGVLEPLDFERIMSHPALAEGWKD